MKKLKAQLAALLEKLSQNKAGLAWARRHHRYHNTKAQHNHDRRDEYRKKADESRAAGHPAHARRLDKIANRSERKRTRHVDKRTELVTDIKTIKLKIEHLDTSIEEKKTELAAFKKKHKVTVKGNKVTGGTRRHKLTVALLTAEHNCATGKQNNYYSMSGGNRRYDCTLAGMPSGLIWDCSTFGDGIYYVCGLPDPSKTDYAYGWTGTEGANGKVVDRADAKPGDLVLYGSYPHHHVEVVLDPERELTVGHGSAPIDRGVFDLFGDGNFTIRRYLND